MLRKKNLLKDIMSTTFFAALGKGVGFVIPFFIASWFSANRNMDTFFFTQGLVQFLSVMLTTTVSSIIVPYITGERIAGEGIAGERFAGERIAGERIAGERIAEGKNSGQPEKNDMSFFTGSIIMYSTFIMLAASIIILIILYPVIPLITKFDTAARDLAFTLFIEMVPLVFLFLYCGIFDGILNAYKQFSVPALSPLLRSVIILISMFLLKDRLGIHAIVIANIAGELMRLFILVIMLMIKKIPLPGFSLSVHPKVPEFFRKAMVQIIAATIVSLSPVVDRAMGSWLKEGSVSILYYGERLYYIPVTLFMTGLIITLLSHWSEDYYSKGKEHLNRNVTKAAGITALITIPLSVILIIFYKPVVHLAFGFGAFDSSALDDIGFVYAMYLAGFAPYILAQVYARGHIVLKDTLVLLFCGLLMIVFNAAGNIILMQFLGVGGIALSTSIVNTAGFFFLAIMFRRKVRRDGKNNGLPETVL